MTTDLETLLRETFDGRTRTVTDAPAWQGAPERSRAPWIVSGVVAACAVGAVVASSVLFAPGDGSTPPAGAQARHVGCDAEVPSAWQDAIDGAGLTYGGRPVSVLATTPVGRAVGVAAVGGREVLVSEGVDGRFARLTTAPRGQLAVAADTDGSHAVVNLVADEPKGGPTGPVDRILLIDLGSGRSRDLLAHDTRVGVVIGKYGAVIQSGAVYWIDGPSSQAEHGTVRRFDVSTRRYSDAGTATQPVLVRDVRGVGWPGGGVAAVGAPAGLPAAFDADGTYRPVYSDGATTAWQDPATGLVRVVDGDHTETVWDLRRDPGDRIQLAAASGRYLLYVLDETYTGFVLDVRTGASFYLADASNRAIEVDYPSFVTHHGVTVHLDGSGGVRAYRLDTAALPTPVCLAPTSGERSAGAAPNEGAG